MIHSFILLAVLSSGTLAQDSLTTEAKVNQAARDCRISIYDSYHTQRAEYDLRAIAAQRVIAAWTESGCPEQYARELILWFENARQTDSLLELPACLDDLEQRAQQRANSRAKATPATPVARPVTIVPTSNHTPRRESPVTSGADEAQPSTAAKTTGNVEESFLGGVSRSIFRASIGGNKQSSKARFD